MTVIQVGLVDQTGALDPELVRAAAAAINVQVTRDLPQFWHSHATVIYLPNAKKIPSGVWPVKLVDKLPAGEGGFHLDKHNQPYAKVLATKHSDGWTVAASHEIVEMLVDPYGNRVQSARSIQIVGGKIKDGTSEFAYLVEACDPCEADQYSYSIQGVVVSDFITPRFYDPLTTPATRYSYTGAITAPRQILPGGYISWIDQQTDEWQQLQYLDPTKPPVIKNLGRASAKSLRSWIHTKNQGVKGLQNPKNVSQRPKNKELFEVSTERRATLEAIATRRYALSK
jgi:hypothetical protein